MVKDKLIFYLRGHRVCYHKPSKHAQGEAPLLTSVWISWADDGHFFRFGETIAFL